MVKVCSECRAPARRLRRGRCDACYMRLYRNGEVPPGDACAACGERRRIVLTRGELGKEEVTLCGNCVLVVDRTRARLADLDELRRLAARWRRVLPAPPPPSPPLRSAPVMPVYDPSID